MLEICLSDCRQSKHQLHGNVVSRFMKIIG